MANTEHLEILKQGVEKWNEWRMLNPELHRPDLKGANLESANLETADLNGANLKGAVLYKANLNSAQLEYADLQDANLRSASLMNTNFSHVNLGRAYLVDANLPGANLDHADLKGTRLRRANLSGANLSHTYLVDADLSSADLGFAKLSFANLGGAELMWAKLNNSNLSDANLTGANLTSADLSFANLSLANLTRAILVETNFSNATITGCQIYGISAWNVILEKTIQKDLVILSEGKFVVTVDDLEVAQFIHLMLNNTKIRNVINTVTSKGVLILGRFADPQRKAVLDGLREKLRHFDLLPIVFDFDLPRDKDYTETVQTLAGLSMFVIADLTSPKSTPLELEATVKQFKIPYVPIIDISVDKRPFTMLSDLQNSFHWVLPTLQYESKEDLLDDDNLKEYIIDPVNKKREELRKEKNDEPAPILIRKKAINTPPA